jgi:hypothetical protein
VNLSSVTSWPEGAADINTDGMVERTSDGATEGTTEGALMDSVKECGRQDSLRVILTELRKARLKELLMDLMSELLEAICRG